jgi:hypothetical protein
MVVFLSGKKRHVAVGEPKFEYLALIIFAEKNVKQTSATYPKFQLFVLDFLGGKKWSSSRRRPKVRFLAGII